MWNVLLLLVALKTWALESAYRRKNKYMAMGVERSEASSQSVPRFAKARELLFIVWGLEQEVSQKLSIFDIWCIEEKVFVFT